MSYYDDMEDHYMKKGSPLQRGSRLRSVSPKRVKVNRIYSALAHKYLEKHPFCEHFIAENGLDEAEVIRNHGWYEVMPEHAIKPIQNPNYRGMARVPESAEIHHKRGRGKYLLDVSTFMATRPGHSLFIHGNTKTAYEKGYMLPR